MVQLVRRLSPLLIETNKKRGTMTKPKPKPLGSSIEVADGARVTRPGGVPGIYRTTAAGVYVFDVPGTHTIDGTDYEVSAEREPAAEPKV